MSAAVVTVVPHAPSDTLRVAWIAGATAVTGVVSGTVVPIGLGSWVCNPS